LVALVSAGNVSRRLDGRTRRGVVTMTVGKGLEQGGPRAVIPAREAGDLIASADEHSILAARIHEPLHYAGILRARANSVMLQQGVGSGMPYRWCSASLLVQRPLGRGGGLRAAVCYLRGPIRIQPSTHSGTATTSTAKRTVTSSSRPVMHPGISAVVAREMIGPEVADAHVARSEQDLLPAVAQRIGPISSGRPCRAPLTERLACSTPFRSCAASRRRGRTPWRTWGIGRRIESPRRRP
jgi:hypothetical protein